MARSGPDTRQSLQEFMKANAKVTHVTICWVLYSAICVPPCENGVCDKPVSVSLGGLPADAE